MLHISSVPRNVFGGDFLVEKSTTSCGHVELCDLCTVRAAATLNGNCVSFQPFGHVFTVNDLQNCKYRSPCIRNSGVVSRVSISFVDLSQLHYQ